MKHPNEILTAPTWHMKSRAVRFLWLPTPQSRWDCPEPFTTLDYSWSLSEGKTRPPSFPSERLIRKVSSDREKVEKVPSPSNRAEGNGTPKNILNFWLALKSSSHCTTSLKVPPHQTILLWKGKPRIPGTKWKFPASFPHLKLYAELDPTWRPS